MDPSGNDTESTHNKHLWSFQVGFHCFFGVRALASSKFSFRSTFPRPEWRKIAQVPTHQRAPGCWDELKLGWETWIFSCSGWRKLFVDSLKVRFLATSSFLLTRIFCQSFQDLHSSIFHQYLCDETRQSNSDLGSTSFLLRCSWMFP